MLQRSIYFIVVWFLTINGEIYGQENPQNVEKKLTERKEIIRNSLNKIHKESIVRIDKPTLKWMWALNPTYEKVEIATLNPQSCWAPPLIITFYKIRIPATTENMPFFCKKEWELERVTRTPIKFRLGSQDYVDWLEQKPNAFR